MSELSPASPRCPKCFAQVSEEAAQCPACSFDFSILEQPRAAAKPAKAPAPAKKAAQAPARLAIPVLAAEPVPVLAPQAAATRVIPKPAPVKTLPLRRLAPAPKIAAARSFAWTRAVLFLGLMAVASFMGVAGFRLWAAPGASTDLIMDAPAAAAPSAAAEANPFPQRTPDAVQTQAALVLAGLFSTQLQAMNRTF